MSYNYKLPFLVLNPGLDSRLTALVELLYENDRNLRNLELHKCQVVVLRIYEEKTKVSSRDPGTSRLSPTKSGQQYILKRARVLHKMILINLCVPPWLCMKLFLVCSNQGERTCLDLGRGWGEGVAPAFISDPQ